MLYFAELQLKLEYEVVKALQQYNTRTVHMLTDTKNPSEEEPVLTWRRNVKVSVEKEKQVCFCDFLTPISSCEVFSWII